MPLPIAGSGTVAAKYGHKGQVSDHPAMPLNHVRLWVAMTHSARPKGSTVQAPSNKVGISFSL